MEIPEQIRCITLILFLIAGCCTLPALAAVHYIEGSPELSALVTGSNEFSPGDTATIGIMIRNSGLNTFKFVNSGTIARDDLPNTAKLVTVQLLPGTAPVTIKTDPQTIGDIPGGGGTARLNVAATIANDAAAGNYTLPLLVQYRYLASSVQEGSDQMQFIYETGEESLPLTIRIRPHVRISILSAEPDGLNVGMEGYLRVSIRNDGSDDGRAATVILTRSASSPVVPTDSSVFVGDFPSGGVVDCTYKVAVSGEAEEGSYPVDISVTYRDNEGSVVTSDKVTIGIPVSGKARFSVDGPASGIPAGEDTVVEVGYRNTGQTAVYQVQTRISVVPPFTSGDDTAYLGDLRPGQLATARYRMSVPAGTEPADYTFDSEVRYSDARGNSQSADTLRVTVRVLPEKGSAVLGVSPVVLLVLAACIIGAGYYLLVMRKKE